MNNEGKRKLAALTKMVYPDHPAHAEPKKELSLYEKRNELLINRYVYYLTLKTLKMDEVLVFMVADFHITAPRICDIIEKNIKAVSALRKEKKQVRYYREKWPNMNW